MKSMEENQINEKSAGGDSDTEMLNLEKELYSLTHYADDVEELVSQMFSSIKGVKLQAMLPPILKEIPLIDVQQLCLHELRGMSSRRILSIINGVEMSDSSSEEEDDLIDLNSKTEADEKNSREYNSESIEVESLKDLSLVDDPLLTALDVRQLEMRAKLIKNMLSKQPGEDSGEEEKEEMDLSSHDPNIKIKEEPLSSDEEARKKDKRSRRHRSSSYGSSRSSSSNSSSSYSSYSSRSTHSSDSDKQSQKSNQDDSPDTKKHKKKISKKEFEARMKKARMNRSYRKRKVSDDDSVKESRSRHRRKRKLEKQKEELTPELMETSETKENGIVEENLPEKSIEIEKQEKELLKNEKEDNMVDNINEEKVIEDPPEEGEVLEKEEGEIDSNEENYYSNSRSSSYSSRSYSSSPKRHRRHKRRSRRRKTRTPPIPKVPNWEPGSKSALPKKTGKTVEESKSVPLAPLTEDRQSVSFTLSKKSGSSSVVAPDTAMGENTPSAGILSVNKKVETADISTSELQEIPLKIKEHLTEPFCEISGSEEEDGAVQENSDGDLQDDSVIDPIQNMDVDDGSAPLEEESPDASEALEDVTTSEVFAEDTSQDALEPGEEEDGAYEQETTEIIGVIDPMDDNATSAFNDVSNSSWSTRWLQSEKVQQVVSDSKMLSKMRKNIQAKGKTKVRKTPSTLVVPQAVADNKMKISKVDLKSSKRAIGGNAEDHENMFGIKVKAPQSLPAPKSQKPLPVTPAVDIQTKTKSLASTLLDSDDDDDDSEDDELWSKIMKK